mgnify:CR=1 FL=1|tara:strand:- start:1042 stop:1581 length:540 start_codon:yes stop_codon:yes gene_type:complete
MVKSKLITIFLFLIYGCATTQPRTETLITDDPFSSSIEVRGVPLNPISTAYTGRGFLINSFINKSNFEVKHQVYIREEYYKTDWDFYDLATITGGYELPLTQLSRDVGNCSSGSVYTMCSFIEELGIDISTQLLQQGKGGFSIKLFSQSGSSFVITITEEQITKQFNSINSVLETLTPL